MVLGLLLPWDFVAVGATTISRKEDIFNQFLNPFLEKCDKRYKHNSEEWIMYSFERLDNVHVIDTEMFGFVRYNAAYLVEGEEIALVDTGLPNKTAVVRGAIESLGFSIQDISYIFITHSHQDHCGNVAPFLRENPKAKVYIHPAGSQNLTDPSIENARHKEAYPDKMVDRFGDMEPVPASRIRYLNDGDVFDLGKGEKLKVIFAPGHRPDGIVILEQKNMGLFINDLAGAYFPDAPAQYPFSPPGSDHRQAIESLRKLVDLRIEYLYLGHFGICGEAKHVIAQSIKKLQQLLDIGKKCMEEGQPWSIATEVYKVIVPELEKLRSVRGENVYQYATHEHVSSQAKLFANYFQDTYSPSS
jgi:glyoxylase-like metal-dependent hydrolase (beta-lactamase superfamily II)